VEKQTFSHEIDLFSKSDCAFPTTEQTVDSVTIDISFGYTDADAVPKAVKTAIIESVLSLLQGSCDNEKSDILCNTSKTLLRKYKNTASWLKN